MNLTSIINNQLSRLGVAVSIIKKEGLYRGFFKGRLNRLSQDGFLLVTYSDTNDSSCHFQISVGKQISQPVGFLTKSNITEFNSNHTNAEFPINFINERNKVIYCSSGANIEFSDTKELVEKVSTLLKNYIDVLETGAVGDVFLKYDTEVELQKLLQ